MSINLFEYALKIFLFIGVILYVPFHGTDKEAAVEWGYQVQDLFFRYGVIFIYCVAQMQKPIRELKIKSLPILIMYIVLASLINGFGVIQRSSILNIFMWFLLYKCVFEHLNFSKIKSYALWFGAVLMLNAAFCALQYNGQDFIFQSSSQAIPGLMDTVVGFLRVKVHLGVLAAILFPIVLIYAPIFSILVLPLLYFGVSSAAVIATVASSLSLSFMLLKRKWAVLISLTVLAAGICFVIFYDMPGGQFGERLKVWKGATSYVMHGNPIMGEGIGSFKALNFATVQKSGELINWSWVHNEFVQGFFEIGIIGMAIVFCFLGERQKEFEMCGKDKIMQVFYCSCISILIISIFHFPFHLSRFSHLIAFFFAGLHARREDMKYA